MAKKTKRRTERWIKFSDAVGLVAKTLGNSAAGEYWSSILEHIPASSTDYDSSDANANKWSRVQEYIENISSDHISYSSLISPIFISTKHEENHGARWDYLRQHFNMFQSSLKNAEKEVAIAEAATLLCDNLFRGNIEAFGVCNGRKLKMPHWVFSLKSQQAAHSLATESQLIDAADNKEYVDVMFEEGELHQFLSELGVDDTSTDDAPTPKKRGRPGKNWKKVEKLLREEVESDPEITKKPKIHLCRVVARKYNKLVDGESNTLKAETIRDKKEMQAVFEELGFGGRSKRTDLQNCR